MHPVHSDYWQDHDLHKATHSREEKEVQKRRAEVNTRDGGSECIEQLDSGAKEGDSEQRAMVMVRLR
jgi:hypothetical protein